MAYEQKKFVEGQILTADHMNDIEEAIISNEKVGYENTHSIENQGTILNTHGSAIEELTKKTQSQGALTTELFTSVNQHTEDIVKLKNEKLDSLTSISNSGKILYVNDNKIDFKDDAIIASSIPGSVVNGVDYYIGTEGKYTHYRGINNKLEQIGTSEDGMIYRSTYGKVSGDGDVIEGVPSNTDPKYVFRLWQISAKDFAKNTAQKPYIGADSKWVVVSTDVIGADIERSIITAKLDPDLVKNIELSKLQFQPTYLKFTVNSQNPETGGYYGIEYRVTLRNRVIASGTLPIQSTNHEVVVEVTDVLVEGQNLFQISLVDSIGSKEFLFHTINCVDFTASADFQYKQIDKGQSGVYLTYSVRGSQLEKKVYLTMTNDSGEEVHSDEGVVLNDQGSINFLIPTEQEHGRYLIRCYSQAQMNEEYLELSPTYFDLIIVDKNQLTPIISCPQRGEAIETEQFSTISLSYYVYDENRERPTTKVEVVINEGAVIYSAQIPQEEKQHTFTYKFSDIGNYFIRVYTLSEKEEEPDSEILGLEVEVRISELTVHAKRSEIVASSVMLDFDATLARSFETTNGLEDGEVTYYQRLKVGERKGENKIEEIYFNANPEFDWINGGYKIDSDGVNCFVIKAGDSITVNHQLFGPSRPTIGGTAVGIGSTGRSLKLVFKTQNATNSKAPFLTSYVEENIGSSTRRSGLKMAPQEACFYQGNAGADNSTLHLPYSENDEIDFCLTLSKNINNEVTSEVQDYLQSTVVYGYEDGVSTKPMLGVDYGLLSSAENFVIGSDDCDTILYRLRVYNKSLTDEEVLIEFINDAKDATTIKERDLRNYLDSSAYQDFENNTITESNFENYFQSLSNKYKDLRFVLIKTDKFTNGKDTKVGGTTVYHWYKGGRSVEDNWMATNAIHSGQGTSSNNYGAAARNLDIDLTSEECIITSLNKTGEQEEVLNNISLTPTSIPNRYFNIKVNVASSENANNALLQRRYNEYNPYVRPFVDSQIITTVDEQGNTKEIAPKDTMEFHNCAVFLWETGEEPRERYLQYRPNTGWVYETNNNINFYGLGNIGDSKKTDITRLTDPNDPFEFILEIMDVGLPLCDFPLVKEQISYSYDHDDDLNTDNEIVTKTAEDWLEEDGMNEQNGSTYGWRYIYDTGLDVNGKAYKKGQTPVANLSEEYIEEAKRILFPNLSEEELMNQSVEGYTIADVCKKIWKDFYYAVTEIEGEITSIEKQNDDTYLVTYSNGITKSFKDIIELRTGTAPEDWGDNIGQKVVMDSVVYYSLFTTRYTMVDNRAKNSFWHYGKTKDGSRKWDLSFDYDNDTALGIDNKGELNYRYGYEDTDLEDPDISSTPRPVFREHDSTFFCRLVNKCQEKFSEVYNNVRVSHKDAWTSSSLISQFDTWQEQFPERFWKLDARKKYLNSYRRKDGDIDTTQFLKEMACGKKKYQRRQFERNQYNYMGVKYRDADMPSIYFRAVTAGPLGGDDGQMIVLTVDGNCYVAAAAGNGDISKATLYRRTGENNTVELTIARNDMYKIWGTPWIQEIKDLGKLDNLGTAAMGKASRLKALDVSDSETLNSLQLTENGPIKELNFTDATLLSSFSTLPYDANQNENSELGGANGFETLFNLNTVLAGGSGITNFTFREGMPIQKLILSSAATTLVLPKMNSLKELSYSSSSQIATLKIDGGSLNPEADMVSEVKDENKNPVTSKEIVMFCRSNNSLRSAELYDIHWNLVSSSSEGSTSATSDYNLIEYLYNLKDVNGNYSAELSGFVHFAEIDNISLEKYKQRWQDVTFTYTTLKQKYWVRFLGGDKPIEYVVDAGGVIKAPEGPEKMPTDSVYYQFECWYHGSNENDTFAVGQEIIINADTMFHAKFIEKPQMYEVKCYEAPGSLIYAAKDVEYGKGLSEEQLKALEIAVLAKQITNQGASNKLFVNWDKTPHKILGSLVRVDGNLLVDNSFPCKYRLNPVEIYAIWDKPQSVDYKKIESTELTAADLSSIISSGNLDIDNEESVLQTASLLKMPVGFRMPTEDYFGKAPVYPFGKEGVLTYESSNPITTKEELLDLREDWTLLVDFRGISETSSGPVVIIGDYWDRHIKIQYQSFRYQIVWGDKTQQLDYSYLPYDNSSSNNNAAMDRGCLREVVVLQHKKENPNDLEVYASRHYRKTHQHLTLSRTSNMDDTAKVQLSAGGIAQPNTFAKKCSSEIFNCMLWNDYLLAEADIERLIKWPKEDFYWVVVGSGKYEYTDGKENKTTSIDLYCAQAFERAHPTYQDEDNKPASGVSRSIAEKSIFSFGFLEDKENCEYITETNTLTLNQVACDAAQWLNDRFYDSISKNWQTIMAKANVPCTSRFCYEGAAYNGPVISSPLSVWLPSTYEHYKYSNGQTIPQEGEYFGSEYFGVSKNRHRERGQPFTHNDYFYEGEFNPLEKMPGDRYWNSGAHHMHAVYTSMGGHCIFSKPNKFNPQLMYRTVSQSSYYGLVHAWHSDYANINWSYAVASNPQNDVMVPCISLK